MIRRLRYALSIVRDISMILCPASASVQRDVQACRDAEAVDRLGRNPETLKRLQEFDPDAAVEMDVMEPFHWHGPVAGVAAGTGPGQVSADAELHTASSPCPGQPQEPEHVAELVRYHHVTANQVDGVYCHCGHVSHNDRRHAHHVAQLVEDMIAADVRLANRFRQSGGFNQ